MDVPFSFHWPRTTTAPTDHLTTVATNVGPGLIWLAVEMTQAARSAAFAPYATAFGCHLALMGISRVDLRALPVAKFGKLVVSCLAGLILTIVQLAIHPTTPGLPAVMAVAVIAISIVSGGIAFLALLPNIFGSGRPRDLVHWAGFTIALAASAVTFVFIR